MMVLYRPYLSIQKSVECLENVDIPRFGIIECHIILRAIFTMNGWTEGSCVVPLPDIEYYRNEPIVQFYNNNGTPYTNDLLKYFKVAKIQWPKNQGIPIDYVKDIRKEYRNIRDLCATGRAPWTQKHARLHKLALLERHWFWYKRFFRHYFELDLTRFKNPKTDCIDLYEDGKPRGLTYEHVFPDR